jgi:hypothetical protein
VRVTELFWERAFGKMPTDLGRQIKYILKHRKEVAKERARLRRTQQDGIGQK